MDNTNNDLPSTAQKQQIEPHELNKIRGWTHVIRKLLSGQ
jgi:hypothetical protein